MRRYGHMNCCVMGMILASAIGGLLSCAATVPSGPVAEALHTPEGLAQWEQQERTMQEAVQTAQDRYRNSTSLDELRKYDHSVRAYLDHGFLLYRHYRAAHMDPPPGLIASLERRTGLLMDVADQYIEHGSLAMAEGIASDVVHDYADLPVFAPAQRRAEALLLHHRYRQDY